MIYRCKSCASCGSAKIEEIEQRRFDEDIFITYKCSSCDCVFSSKKVSSIKKEVPLNKNNRLSAVEIFEKTKGAILEIRSENADDVNVGTGFIISNSGYALTNAHIIAEVNAKNNVVENLSDSIWGKNNVNEHLFELEILACDAKKDMALLKIDSEFKDFIEIQNIEVKTGEKIYAIGNSKGEGLCILDGIVSDNNRIIDDNSYTMISAPVTNGNSGGPVFNDFGKIIGMVVSGRKSVSSMNYVIKIEDVISFINKVEKNEQLEIIK